MAVKEINPEKLKALQLTMEKLDKTFGKGSVMKLGDNAIEEVDVIPTGSITLDLALGVNGYPKGRIVEIYGPESSGKTTLAIHAIAEVQKQGGIAAFIDAEHAFDQFYAQKLGVDGPKWQFLYGTKDSVYTLAENTWNNQTTLQLMLRDIKIADN